MVMQDVPKNGGFCKQWFYLRFPFKAVLFAKPRRLSEVVGDPAKTPIYYNRFHFLFHCPHTVDGGNLAPLLQRKFFTAPYPLLNIGIENLQKQICSNDGNLAPPQTEQLSMLKRGCGDASSSHRRCLLCRWCKISSIHSPVYGV